MTENSYRHSSRISSLQCASLAFIASRLLVAAFVYLGHANREFLTPVIGGWEGVANWWLNPWTTFDSKWFMSVAAQGYQEHTTPFFPLYPLLLRLGGTTDTGMAIAGIAISNLCLLGSLYLFHRLTSEEHGPKIAWTGVWLLAFFPTAAFFSAVYSDSLFLLLLLSTFHAARQGQWHRAGMFGLFGALTRNPGFLIFLALLMEYFSSLKAGQSRPKILVLFSLSLPLVGFGGVQSYFWTKFGPMAGIKSQEFYSRSLGWPWTPLWKDFSSLFYPNSDIILILINLFCIIFPIVFFFLWGKNIRKSYHILTMGVIIMHLTYQRTIPIYTVASVRYMSSTFPFTQMLGICLNRMKDFRLAQWSVMIFYFFLCFVFSYAFGLKNFLA